MIKNRENIITKMISLILRQYQKFFLVFQVLPYVFFIVFFKFLVVRFGGELVEYSPLIGNMVAANLFLLGFVVGETLREFRMSEKIPGTIVSGLENMVDIILEVAVYDVKRAKELLAELMEFAKSIRMWLYRHLSTAQMHGLIHDIANSLSQEDKGEKLRKRSLDNFFKERNEIRKNIIAIDVMRKTEFVSSGYTIAKLYTMLLIILLIFTKFPSQSSFVFVLLIAFTALYLIFLVEDLDNPFTYSQEERNSSKVSLRQLKNFELRCSEQIEQLS